MSLTELVNTYETRDSHHQQKKPILKSSQQKIYSTLPRLDWAGNEIIKGGSHKIAFISQENTSRTFLDLLSNELSDQSDEVDEDYNEMLNCQNVKNVSKLQPELSEQSNCCFIY
ncbi:unnamed protein product (macronuclear) [Paramecium tetraurelia]|uniref:Uncharacterized protein n=1 Tax=Paramecium tetraurelia TaxID=5888 RepID=A0CFW8_PARTE|nr:uncharacterized protein GSPATT00038127001 [Paramecium tetraurelia]CAK69685.1 unnamed protein product [Paramecium tetraurelia]|eukprot:XP_001437082.1 hypothetical protein (macronuclear) [Paramecium tetraurelia strain d4-2]